MPTGVYERKKTTPKCHPRRKYKAEGLCRHCYNVKYYGEKVKSIKPWVRMIRLYGLTKTQYDDLLARQGGGCAICGSKDPYHSNDGRLLIVDHDHVTGKVRGLLCSKCNKGLGLFGDSVVQLKKAIKYMEEN